MSDEDTACVSAVAMAGVVLLIIAISAWLSCAACWTSDVTAYRARAVELGAASWVVDLKTGETTFTWKDGKP